VAFRSAVVIVFAGLVTLTTTRISTSVSAQSPPEELLAKVRAFVVRFQQEAPSIVAREHYKQTVSYRRTDPFGPQAADRTLISELVMVRLPGTAGWISFRDVLEVDGRTVNDRERRLVELLQNPNPTAVQQARQLAAESARYNVGQLTRTFNVPDIALEYLSARHADRITFTRPERVRIGGREATSLRFSEDKGPTILRNPEGRDLRASGRVWVDSETAALVRTELIVRDRSSSGSCIVDFIRDERTGATVPAKMTERYNFSGGTIDAVAQYSNYRRFGVSTDEKLTKPPGVER
jgi:hypothetical protein